ncbi:transketolase C-terminal domain-containing protein [Streptomyces sp. SL13]|uniref:dihydrolipoyllysine-residue succinyltransferase n=1 Tax=Streptantibioticus silvisoli TaxID=2705255 RepID=A0AA90H945_9ACTN|nr:transketolase C-terminal domain-containing protein [Streptantibioticus silvisoli]MDI5971105.1 transketolase C-terminal domain-containing protein [Streptantibioticus silvisoli]
MLRSMIRVRHFEKAAALLADRGLAPAVRPLPYGGEALAVGSCAALRPGDRIAAVDFGHGPLIARGARPDRLLAELLGGTDGYCRGTGGPAFAFDAGLGFIGANGPGERAVPAAVGAAWADLRLGRGHVTLVLCGEREDAAAELHESLRFARDLGLPVVLLHQVRAAAPAGDGGFVDGHDVEAVRRAVDRAARTARDGGGPCLLAVGTAGAERLAGEPPAGAVAAYAERLTARGVLDAGSLRAIEREEAAAARAAIRFAEASRPADPDQAFHRLFAEPRPRTRPSPARDRPRTVAATGPHDPARTAAAAVTAAVWDGLGDAMAEDDCVVVVRQGGRYGETRGGRGARADGAFRALEAEFGGDRVREARVSGAVLLGVCAGAAALGLRPVADLLDGDAVAELAGPLEHAGRLRSMSGGAVDVPLVCLVAAADRAPAPSRAAHAVLLGIPGLKIAVPSTPDDARGLLLSAVRDPNPAVLVVDEDGAGRVTGANGTGGAGTADGPAPVPDRTCAVALGVAGVVRPGDDVTVVALGSLVPEALRVARRLAGDGISVEVIDARTVAPLDLETVLESAARTGRLVVCDNAHRTGSFAAVVIAAAQVVHPALKAPPQHVAWEDLPVAYAPVPEARRLVGAADIAAAIRLTLMDRPVSLWA